MPAGLLVDSFHICIFGQHFFCFLQLLHVGRHSTFASCLVVALYNINALIIEDDKAAAVFHTFVSYAFNSVLIKQLRRTTPIIILFAHSLRQSIVNLVAGKHSPQSTGNISFCLIDNLLFCSSIFCFGTL